MLKIPSCVMTWYSSIPMWWRARLTTSLTSCMLRRASGWSPDPIRSTLRSTRTSALSLSRRYFARAFRSPWNALHSISIIAFTLDIYESYGHNASIASLCLWWKLLFGFLPDCVSGTLLGHRSITAGLSHRNIRARESSFFLVAIRRF
jgi:hypothetical protein